MFEACHFDANVSRRSRIVVDGMPSVYRKCGHTRSPTYFRISRIPQMRDWAVSPRCGRASFSGTSWLWQIVDDLCEGVEWPVMTQIVSKWPLNTEPLTPVDQVSVGVDSQPAAITAMKLLAYGDCEGDPTRAGSSKVLEGSDRLLLSPPSRKVSPRTTRGRWWSLIDYVGFPSGETFQKAFGHRQHVSGFNA